MNKEFDDFVGEKMKKLTMTFSFRLTVKEINKLLNGEFVEIKIKGKKFTLVPEKGDIK